MKPQVWFITGCSSGLGRALAEEVVDQGFQAVVTARAEVPSFEWALEAADRVLPLKLDVTRADEIRAAVDAAMRRFGRIDVLVNNAGYGYQATAEEALDSEVRALFETNVFGLFSVTRAIIPVMRAQRSGFIVNVTSVAGFVGLPGSGYYAASKHAIEGWSDALAAEVGPIGIGVTCIAPGPLRTAFSATSLRQTPVAIADYLDTAGKRLKETKRASGHQPGDPRRAAKAIIAVTQMKPPPRSLVLGKSGFDTVSRALGARLAQITALEEMSVGADFSGEADASSSS